MNELVKQVLATTDVTSMAREVVEAYRLTVTRDRDLAAIDATLQMAMKDADQLHEQIMLGLEEGFKEREVNLKIIHGYVAAMMAAGQYDAAQQTVTHLMKLMEKSPTDRAIEQRATRYRPAAPGDV